MPKLTKKIVESTFPQEKDILLWDSEVKGFCCKITPAGKRSYFLYYRTHDRRQRKPKIGDHGSLTCEQAKTIAQGWLLEVSQGKDPSGGKKEHRLIPTIKELADQYMKEYAPHKKTKSQKEDLRQWNRYILPALKNIKVSAIEKKDIAKLHHSLQHLPITANRVLSLLSKALNLAELWGYRLPYSNPCPHIKKYKEEKREKFLTQEEIAKLSGILAEEERNSKNPWAIYAIRLLLITGCRLNEVLTLQWKEVDFINNCLRLSNSKTGKKLVYLSVGALDILKSIPKIEDNPYVICGKKKGSHLVNLQKPWRRFRKKAGLETIRLHDLRHTFASIGVSQGLSLPMIGALLGHKQPQTTARYAHLMGQTLIDASNTIGKQILGQ